jgi:hypothetical protein
MFIESLENRTLMSSTAVSSQVTMDRLQIREDLLQFRTDIVAGELTMISDVKALKADDVGQDATLVPLFKTLHSDVKTMQAALLTERLGEKANVLADESAIVTEQIKFIEDKGNPTARAADRAQLLSEHIELQNDEIAGLDARIATRTADETTITNDLNAIATAVDSDSGASAQVMADVNKFTTDRAALLTTLTADLNKIATDRAQLVTDLIAIKDAT